MKRCQDFLKNPDTNPRTGRCLKRDGPTYNRLMEECRRHMKGPAKFIEAQLAFVEGLKPEDKDVVRAYIGGGVAYPINEFLRAPSWTKQELIKKNPEMYEYASRLQKIIYRAPTWPNESFFLYRQILMKRADFNRLRRDETYVAQGFQSFSTSTFFMTTFTPGLLTADDPDVYVIMVARVRPGSHLLTAFNPGEDEALLPHGMVWHLDLVRPNEIYTLGPGFRSTKDLKFLPVEVQTQPGVRVLDITIWTPDNQLLLESFAPRRDADLPATDLNVPLSRLT